MVKGDNVFLFLFEFRVRQAVCQRAVIGQDTRPLLSRSSLPTGFNAVFIGCRQQVDDRLTAPLVAGGGEDAQGLLRINKTGSPFLRGQPVSHQAEHIGEVSQFLLKTGYRRSVEATRPCLMASAIARRDRSRPSPGFERRHFSIVILINESGDTRFLRIGHKKPTRLDKPNYSKMVFPAISLELGYRPEQLLQRGDPTTLGRMSAQHQRYGACRQPFTRESFPRAFCSMSAPSVFCRAPPARVIMCPEYAARYYVYEALYSLLEIAGCPI